MAFKSPIQIIVKRPQKCPYCGAALKLTDIVQGVHDACDKPKEETHGR